LRGSKDRIDRVLVLGRLDIASLVRRFVEVIVVRDGLALHLADLSALAVSVMPPRLIWPPEWAEGARKPPRTTERAHLLIAAPDLSCVVRSLLCFPDENCHSVQERRISARKKCRQQPIKTKASWRLPIGL